MLSSIEFNLTYHIDSLCVDILIVFLLLVHCSINSTTKMIHGVKKHILGAPHFMYIRFETVCSSIYDEILENFIFLSANIASAEMRFY